MIGDHHRNVFSLFLPTTTPRDEGPKKVGEAVFDDAKTRDRKKKNTCQRLIRQFGTKTSGITAKRTIEQGWMRVQ